MRPKTATILGSVLAGLGVLCLIVAAIFYWGVKPSQAQLPADTDTTRQYEGTAKVLLNPDALASGDKAHAVAVNTPVDASRTVKVLATSGSAAQVSDKRTITASGQTVGSTSDTYAVDRKSLAATTDHPSSWNVIAAQGLTVSWPIGAEKKDYTGWVNETQSTTNLKYQKEESRDGISTYVYQTQTQPAPIKDKQVLDTLPAALPVSALGALSSVLPLPDTLKSQLATLLPRLTQPVPLSYLYSITATYWVEPTTGTVVDVQQEEVRQAGLSLPGGTTAPQIPVYDVSVHATDNSVSTAVHEAKDNANKIHLVGTTLPLVFLIVGIVLILAGIAVFLLGRRRRAPDAPAGMPAT
jgi:hypothetical protein